MDKHIILVGFMCSGKTTYGKLLASAIDMPFIDMDKYIATKEDKSINRIFSEKGEPYFRQLEHETLVELLKSPPMVIAAGGGTPCFYNNMELMNNSGQTVYLQANTEVLFEWIKNSRVNRPLLKGKTNYELFEYIENLLEQRKQFYEQARLTISATGFDASELKSLLNL